MAVAQDGRQPERPTKYSPRPQGRDDDYLTAAWIGSCRLVCLLLIPPEQ